MSAISDFYANYKADYAKISSSVDNILADMKNLKDTIDELQNSSGTVTPEDQALLDEIQALSTTTVQKLEALDAATEGPIAPPPPDEPAASRR